MMRPCPACSRHVRDATCPFCGAAVATAAPRSVFAGPVTRAAVFSALAGCWTSNPPPTEHVEHETEVKHQESKPAVVAAGTIHGTVLDSNTGNPVQYAQVLLVELDRPLMTDIGGHFKFEGVPPGTYTIRVSAHGNNPHSGGASAQYPVTVTDTQGAELAAQLAIPVYHYNPHQAPMPYGAPPARKRVV